MSCTSGRQREGIQVGGCGLYGRLAWVGVVFMGDLHGLFWVGPHSPHIGGGVAQNVCLMLRRMCLIKPCVVFIPSVVMGVSEHLVSDAEEALGWLGVGNAARITGATGMNQRSSRSHAVFTVHVSTLQ